MKKVIMMTLLKYIMAFVTGEFLLTGCGYNNGGFIVVLRSLWIAAITTIMTGLFVYWNSLELLLCKRDSISVNGRKEIVTVFWVVFAATYAGLYARFSSQWSYMAHCYNAFDQREYEFPFNKNESQNSISDRKETLTSMKIAFIDDAINLHLVTKKSFIHTINQWLKDEDFLNKYRELDNDDKKKEQEIDKWKRRIRLKLDKANKGDIKRRNELILHHVVIISVIFLMLANFLYLFVMKQFCG